MRDKYVNMYEFVHNIKWDLIESDIKVTSEALKDYGIKGFCVLGKIKDCLPKEPFIEKIRNIMHGYDRKEHFINCLSTVATIKGYDCSCSDDVIVIFKCED